MIKINRNSQTTSYSFKYLNLSYAEGVHIRRYIAECLSETLVLYFQLCDSLIHIDTFLHENNKQPTCFIEIEM